MLLEFACQCRGGTIARRQDNKSLDDLTAHFIGTGNHSRLGNGGVFFEGTLHFERANTIASADDGIIGAPHETEVARLILLGAISSELPVTANVGNPSVPV